MHRIRLHVSVILSSALSNTLPRSQQRRPNETLEDWLRRIEVSVDFQLYSDIRYGDMSETIVTDDEILRFEQQLARYSTI